MRRLEKVAVKVLFFIVFMHCIYISSVGQGELSINTGYDIRSNFGYTFNHGGSILSYGASYHYQLDASYSLNLNYRFNRYFAIEGGAEYSEFSLGLNDKKFRSSFNINSTGRSVEVDRDGYVGGMQQYYDLHSTFYTYLPLVSVENDGIFWYIGLGGHWNKGTSGVNFDDRYTQNNEHLRLYSRFPDSFWGARIQTGYLVKLLRFYLYVGFSYNIPIAPKPVITADYTVTQNNVQLYTDHVTANGNNFGVSLRFGWVLGGKYKNKYKHTSDLKNYARYKHHLKHIIHKPKAKRDSIPNKIENRKVEVSHYISTKNKRITIKLSDNVTEDGDVASLNLNGKWIIENYTLTTREKVIHAKLHSGKNYLSLHAVQLGQYPPCTLSITIEDGAHKHIFTLNSTLESSGMVEIILR